MGPYGSVWGDIKTGRSPMTYDHFWTPPDPKMAHKNQTHDQKVNSNRNSNCLTQQNTMGECCPVDALQIDVHSFP